MRYLLNILKLVNKGIEIEIIFQNADSKENSKKNIRIFLLFYFLYLNLEKNFNINYLQI